ncbi:hypothetical protein F01_421017 [Burkholderia cenocepacia]|nr:hypothetical protein F01_421017 [Burkholderia cenocepacia]
MENVCESGLYLTRDHSGRHVDRTADTDQTTGGARDARLSDGTGPAFDCRAGGPVAAGFRRGGLVGLYRQRCEESRSPGQCLGLMKNNRF